MSVGSPVIVLSEGFPKVDYPMIVTSETFINTLNSLPKTSEWIIDVETNGLDPYNMNQICGIGLRPLTDSAVEGYYFPFRHQSEEPNLTQSELEQLVSFINNTCTTVIGYNVKFDAKFLEKQGMNISDMQMIDVLVMVRMTEATTVNKLSLLDITIKDYGENAGQYDLNTDKILKL